MLSTMICGLYVACNPPHSKHEKSVGIGFDMESVHKVGNLMFAVYMTPKHIQ